MSTVKRLMNLPYQGGVVVKLMDLPYMAGELAPFENVIKITFEDFEQVRITG